MNDVLTIDQLLDIRQTDAGGLAGTGKRHDDRAMAWAAANNVPPPPNAQIPMLIPVQGKINPKVVTLTLGFGLVGFGILFWLLGLAGLATGAGLALFSWAGARGAIRKGWGL